MKKGEYRRFRNLMSLLDGFFVVALFVCVTDSFWVLFTIIKWLPSHPDSAIQIWASLGRDIAGSLLFGLLVYDHFKSGALQFNKIVMGLLLICFGTQAIWFDLSPSPAFTDYVYAWRHGADLPLILGSWILSHWIMRIPLWIGIVKTKVP